MRLRNYCFLLLIFLLHSVGTAAQSQTNVNGKWYGIATPAVESPTNAYLVELVLTQHGTLVTGWMNYYFRNGYFSNGIKGNYNTQTRALKLNFIPVLYHQTTNVATGVDCMMETQLKLTVNKVESVLTGVMNSDEAHKFVCSDINLRLVKQMKETTLEEFVEEQQEPEKPAPLTAEQVAQKTTEQLFVRRSTELVRELDFHDDSVRVDLYDNGEFDRDSISVFYDGKLKVLRQELDTRKPISFYVHIQAADSLNMLSMMAENLGSIPPNAALMVISDSKNRYEVNLNSNYQKNAAVRLRKVVKSGFRPATLQ